MHCCSGGAAGVVDAVADRIPVLFDSGIRRGADVFKSIAMGAKAVLVGRPYLWELAIAGSEGVKEVINRLMADFDITMVVSGCRSLQDVARTEVVSPQVAVTEMHDTVLHRWIVVASDLHLGCCILRKPGQISPAAERSHPPQRGLAGDAVPEREFFI